MVVIVSISPAFSREGWRAYAYAFPLAAATLTFVLLGPGVAPRSDPACVAVGAALLVGALLCVRLRPGEPGTPLLLIPAVAADVRFGLAGLPTVGFASLAAGLVHGVRGTALLAAVGHDSLAYTMAQLDVGRHDLGIGGRLATFAAVYVVAQASLWLNGWEARGYGMLARVEPTHSMPSRTRTGCSPLAA